MEHGRRKIRICLLSIVIAAIVIGICYYYGSGEAKQNSTEGTLIRLERERNDGC